MNMEMKKVSAGKLRAIGYDATRRSLRVEMDNGDIIEYSGVPQETYRRLSAASAMWSYFRDNIEEEFSGKRVR
jgi:KTSC domain-containing protein